MDTPTPCPLQSWPLTPEDDATLTARIVQASAEEAAARAPAQGRPPGTLGERRQRAISEAEARTRAALDERARAYDAAVVSTRWPLRLDATGLPGILPGETLPLAFATRADLEALRAARADYDRHKITLAQYAGGCSDMQASHRAAFPAFAQASDALDRLQRKAKRLRRELDGTPSPTPLRDSLAPVP